MNGKYIIFYTLILAAMAGLLVVGLFDRRFLNCDEPIQATLPDRGAPPSSPVTDSRATRYHGKISSNEVRNSQLGIKTNLQGKFYSEGPINRGSATNCGSDSVESQRGAKR